MSRPSIDAVRTTRRLHLIHRVGAAIVGVAIGATLFGLERLALAAIILVLFLQLFALEALRVLALSFREHLK